MPDGSLPAACAARLRRAEARQRRETKQRGLYAEPVSVDGLWLLQRGRCACGCKAPLDPLAVWDEKAPPEAYPVIAHVFARGSKGGHDIENVRIWRHACNAKAARRETSEAASVKRFAPDFSKKERTEGAPQPRSKWPKGRKLQSRNSFTTAKERAAVRALREKTPIEEAIDA